MSSTKSERMDGQDTPEKDLQLFVKQMLQSQLFSGSFQERRYVSFLDSYRDVVVISDSETKFKNNLDEVRKRLHQFYLSDAWVGITDSSTDDAPIGICLWTELPETPFGSYWFQVKTIKYRHNEILLRLKCVRLMTTEDLKIQNIPVKRKLSTCAETESQNVTAQNWSLYFEEFKEATNKNMYWFVTTVVTVQNTIQAFKFLSIFIMSVFTGAIHALIYLGDYSLKFLRELSYIINALTPFSLGCLEFVSKVIGGLFILVAMIFKRGQPTFFPPADLRPVQYNSNRGNYRRY